MFSDLSGLSMCISKRIKSILKKSHREIFFLHFFAIHSSSRHEKCYQMLERIFCLFQCSRNMRWPQTLLTKTSLKSYNKKFETKVPNEENINTVLTMVFRLFYTLPSLEREESTNHGSNGERILGFH
jgi:hypothetical protein